MHSDRTVLSERNRNRRPSLLGLVGRDCDSDAMHRKRKALVLGAGGASGRAWQLGVLVGLQQHGCAPCDVDVMVGTSGGAVAAAQLAGGESLTDLVERATSNAEGQNLRRLSVIDAFRLGWVTWTSRDIITLRRRMGALAKTDESEVARQRELFESRLPGLRWPDLQLRVIAVSVATGRPDWFDANSGVSLVDAIMASCALPRLWAPPYFLNAHWMDGILRSSANADLANDCDEVLAITPSIRGFGKTESVRDQVAALRRHGRQVTLITPSRTSAAAIRISLIRGSRRARAFAVRCGVRDGLDAYSS